MRGRPLKTSTVWKLVRERISSRVSHEIHWAIVSLEAQGAITESRSLNLTAQVAKALAPAPVYVTWVRREHPQVWADTPAKDRAGAVRQGQLDWLDHLIAEAKAKGD